MRERADVEFQRAKELLKDQLIAKQDFDARKAAYEAQQAAVREAEARLVQARAQREQTAAQLRLRRNAWRRCRPCSTRVSDVLRKHDAYAPLDGVVTNLPVRVGETVVPGIQNSPAATIMTIADMSLITAEVKVDETDIVNVKLDQVADITIDAIPNKTFKGHVIEIGNTAILRSTGLAASQSAISSQEAKDFKVVIALDNPAGRDPPGPLLHGEGHHGHAAEGADHPDPGADRAAERATWSRSPRARLRPRRPRPSRIPPSRRRARKKCRAYS